MSPWVGSAKAAISSVTTIDGPSADIVSLGNVAISEDGTAGIVYLKRANGHVHVFAALFSGDAWAAPQQVDAGQRFDSSWPAIAAGDGGRLVVVWAQPFAANVDRLYFSSLDPGARTFQSPHVVDPNIGLAQYVYPSIAMNRGGQALMSYRVVYDDQPGGGLLAGYVLGDIRFARYDGAWWSVSGIPLERNPSQPQRTPTALNSPQVGIGYDGNGVVAWQEPDDNFHDRIWARRIFGNTPGNVLEVSPTSVGTGTSATTLNADADGFSMHVTSFDATAFAVRQQPPSDGKGFTRTRVYVNQLPNEFDPKAGALEGARPVDGGGANGPVGGVGPVAIGSGADGSWDLGFGSGSSSFDIRGAEGHVGRPARLDDGRSSLPGDPLVGRADSGGAVLAWPVDAGVSVLERDPDGTPTQQEISANTGGAVHATDLAASDFGDAVIGFLQGDGAGQTIDAGTVNAPPGAFNVSTPPTWVNSKHLLLQWDPSPHGMTPVSYTVLIDDQDVADGLHRLSYRLNRSQIPSGIHTVSISATDPSLQATDSPTALLMIDRRPPRVSISTRSGRLVVRLSDGPRHQVSGLSPGSTVVRWGDGHSSSGTSRLSHAYSRPGSYLVKVSASDNAGNSVHFKRRVRA